MNPEVAAFTNKVVSHLAVEVRPLQIILFGSQARGDAQRDSDIDLLVVLPDFPFATKRDKRVAVRRSLRKAINLIDDPVVNALVSCPSEIQRIGHVWGWALHDALKEGKVLYERNAPQCN